MLNIVYIISLGALSACASSDNKKFQTSAPMPPLSDLSSSSIMSFDGIIPAAGNTDIALNNAQKNCAFSSFHRKNAIGYEIDNHRQVGLNFSPNIGTNNTNIKVDLRFTMALGGESKKRPKCTYNEGYYGFIPYAINNKINVNDIMNTEIIKSYIQEQLGNIRENNTNTQRDRPSH